MRIVNDQDVSTTARHRAAHTNSKVFPAFVRVPPAGSLAVLLQSHIREDFLVGVHVHQVTDLPAKAHGKFAVVRCFNGLGARITAHQVGRKQIACKFRLCVPRGHVDDQTLQGPSGNAVEGLGHDRVVFPEDRAWPDVAGEIDEVSTCFVLRVNLREPIFKAQPVCFNIFRNHWGSVSF